MLVEKQVIRAMQTTLKKAKYFAQRRQTIYLNMRQRGFLNQISIHAVSSKLLGKLIHQLCYQSHLKQSAFVINVVYFKCIW